MDTADVIVVGLGAVGSAALYQLARRGVAAIGLDRFAPPHDRGSSHGESRITRLAIGEGEEYVPFAIRSHEIWRALESDTGRSLLAPVGGLILGRPADAGLHGRSDFVARTIAAAERFRIAHEVLTAGEVMARFPQFRLVGDETAYYEASAGFVRPEACIEAQLDRARALGASVRTGETVVRLRADAHGATVVTDAASYAAGHVIVAAGAWLPTLAEAIARRLRVYSQSLFWFAPADRTAFAPGRFPIFIWRHGADEAAHFYGVPAIGDGLKLASEQFEKTTTADTPRHAPPATDAAAFHERHVRDRLDGVTGQLLRAETCLYTVTPDFGFVIDRHPDMERMLVASACSGHGFKHSAAIGEALAELVVDGTSRLDVSAFAVSRFEHG